MLTPGLPVVYVPNINFTSRDKVFNLVLKDIYLANRNFVTENIEI